MSKLRPKLIVALDVETLAETRILLDQLEDQVDYYKVGSQLFTSCGPAAVRFIEARGKKVFLDLKFHDIPNTVGNAVRSAVGLSVALERSLDHKARKSPKGLGLHMFTVHTCGGEAMLKAAVEASREAARKAGVADPLVVGVTVLTSEQNSDNIQALVLQRALLAKNAGCDGVVASCHETPFLRKEFGQDFIVVTPGIRPAGAEVQDQKRVATPRDAVNAGSSYLVVGRPIVKADNPRRAVQQILSEIGQA